MHKLVGLTAISLMFAGSVLADDIGFEEQKRQIEANQRAAMNGEPLSSATTPLPEVQDGRDMVGMPLDNAETAGEGIGGDHIIEMDDNEPDAPTLDAR